MPDKKPDHLALVVEGACVSCNRGSLPECILKIKHKDDDKFKIFESILTLNFISFYKYILVFIF